MSDDAARDAADLSADTAVKPLLSSPGLFTADLSERWSFAVPSGGVLMSMALRAMQMQLDEPGLRLLSAHAIFCAPVSAGAITIRVEVLRVGGSAAQVRASLASQGRPGASIELIATFARKRSGPEITGAVFPQVPGPEQAEPMPTAAEAPDNPLATAAFFRNVECRRALGPRWWSGDGGPAEAPRSARWLRYLKPPRDARGNLSRLAIPPLADTMAPAVWQALEPGRPPIQAPSLDLTVHFLEDTRAEWLLASAYARHVSQGYASAEIEIWSEERKLIAYGTQTMTFRPMQRRSAGKGSA